MVRAMNAAFDEGDIEGALAKLHPEVEWHGTKVDWTTERSPGPSRGDRGVCGSARGLGATVARDDRLFDAGDRVVVFFHEVAKGRESGAVVETDTGVIFTVKDGSVVRVDPYMDRDEALEAAGLSE